MFVLMRLMSILHDCGPDKLGRTAGRLSVAAAWTRKTNASEKAGGVGEPPCRKAIRGRIRSAAGRGGFWPARRVHARVIRKVEGANFSSGLGIICAIR